MKKKPNKRHQKLWQFNSKKSSSQIVEEISESISFDRELYSYDIEGSIAHVRMLLKQKIIKASESTKLIRALKKIEIEIQKGQFNFSISMEDIHTHIENRLIEILGQDGKRIHTGRSRNDQVALDTHLYLRDQIKKQFQLLIHLLSLLLERAKKEVKSVWIGYTHLQIGQPVSLAHYLLAYFWKFSRDIDQLQLAYREANTLPLGSAALAGTNYNIDRKYVAKILGFNSIYPNSMDAVSTRDYQLSYHFFASRFFIHLSRLCEDIIIYNSHEFGYVKLGSNLTTGSSIMPQKKNPDIAELLRGKSARVIGNLHSLLLNLKSLPLTYNRDLQEDKIYLFDSCKQVTNGILGITEILKNIKFDSAKTKESLNKGFAQATDLADHLVANYNTPFREAYSIVGEIVAFCRKKKKTLEQLDISELRKFIPNKFDLPDDFFSLEKSIDRKKGIGSTGFSQIKDQMKDAQKKIISYKKNKLNF